MNRYRGGFVAGALLVNVLAGCGDDGGETDTVDTDASTATVRDSGRPRRDAGSLPDAGRDAGPSRRDAGHDAGAPDSGQCSDYTETRRVHWGDLHVHTMFSHDSYLLGNTQNDPGDAMDFAAGAAISLPPFNESGSSTRSPVQLDEPLDFVAVTDHSEFIGEIDACLDSTSDAYGSSTCVAFRNMNIVEENLLNVDVSWLGWGMHLADREPLSICEVKAGQNNQDAGSQAVNCDTVAANVWSEVQAMTEARYDRCEFTTLHGYEWTGQGKDAMKHRNVIFRSGTGTLPSAPVTFYDVDNWEDLAEQLQASCTGECQVLAIPHNSNQSQGLQFEPSDGDSGSNDNDQSTPAMPLDATSAALRAEMEPLVEIFQLKEQSECRNGFRNYAADDDPLCDWELAHREEALCDVCDVDEPAGTGGCIVPCNGSNDTSTTCTRVCGFDESEEDGCTACLLECESGFTGDDSETTDCNIAAWDYTRNVLKIGLEQYQSLGVNPFQLGFIGSTDTHNGVPGYVDETSYAGQHGSQDDEASERLDTTNPLHSMAIEPNPGGIVAVYAEENSREAIFDGLARRETYGTSGPRFSLRFFGGWSYPSDFCTTNTTEEALASSGYSGGVPMGGQLPAPSTSGAAPQFVMRGAKATTGNPLQRLQIIKVWLASDGPHEAVYDLGSEGDFDEASVDLDSCTPSGGPRYDDPQCGLWTDPDFDASEPAAYYARIVEVPSCRWNAFECNAIRGAMTWEQYCQSETAYEGCCFEWASDECNTARGSNTWENYCAGAADDDECCAPIRSLTTQERAWSSPIWYLP